MNNTLKRLVSNTTSNVALHLTRLAITFIMTPIFLHNLGEYDYGIWEIVGAIVGYAGLLQFGLPPAISRHVAVYTTQKDNVALQRLFSSAIISLGSIGLLVASALLLWALLFDMMNILSPLKSLP